MLKSANTAIRTAMRYARRLSVAAIVPAIKQAIGNIKTTKCAFQLRGDNKTKQQKKGAAADISSRAAKAARIDNATRAIDSVNVSALVGLRVDSPPYISGFSSCASVSLATAPRK